MVMAVGKSGEAADRDRLKISFGGHVVAEKGMRAAKYNEAAATKAVSGREVEIAVDLGLGKGAGAGLDLRSHPRLYRHQRQLPVLMAPAERYKLWRERSDGAAPYIVCSMFTPDYRQKAERLAASLDCFALAHALFEAPQVHRSISAGGGDELSFSKPRFIAAMLGRFAKPVLYVDSDVVLRQQPGLIADLCAQRCDFAIYNWLADPVNDAWRPDGAGRWRFFFGIDVASDTQLMASGAVQLWKGTQAAFTPAGRLGAGAAQPSPQRGRSLPGLRLQSSPTAKVLIRAGCPKSIAAMPSGLMSRR